MRGKERVLFWFCTLIAAIGIPVLATWMIVNFF